MLQVRGQLLIGVSKNGVEIWSGIDGVGQKKQGCLISFFSCMTLFSFKKSPLRPEGDQTSVAPNAVLANTILATFLLEKCSWAKESQ